MQKLESMREEIRRRSTGSYPGSMAEEELKDTLKEAQKEAKESEPIFKMYRNMNQSEIIISLASEVNQLRKEYDAMQIQHHKVQDAFAAVKGQKSWNLLCKCVKEVDHMRLVLNEMTEGQFEQGIIEYVDPKRVNNLERRLTRTDKNLQIMELVLDRLQNFKADTEAMLAKCNPILEQLYITEQKEDTTIQDLRNANEISKRIGKMEVDVESMANVITVLMARLEGRIALIEATVKKMQLLDEAKADKDYVQSTFPLMADKELVNKTVTYEDMAKVFNELGEKLMNCFGCIMDIMMKWDGRLEQFQLDTAYSINKNEFSQLMEILDKKLVSLYMRVKDLEIGHIQEQNYRSKDDMIVFKNLRCITCDADAVMNCRPDILIPVPPKCPVRFPIAPQVAYELHALRSTTEGLLKNATDVCKMICPSETSCEVKKGIDTHCKRFGKEICKNDQICTPPNTAESVVKITELDNYGLQVAQLSTKGIPQKKIEELGEMPGQPVTSVDKNIRKASCKSSKKIKRRQ
ncbi:hypothetical protein R5R35_003971 [Gryllus longicercus]|uniref:DUF4795 domain-containing protein n=1 Tax=Gryllus longicercus TaxID=2509291 RepID=A0AAN9VL20_9ORTH